MGYRIDKYGLGATSGQVIGKLAEQDLDKFLAGELDATAVAMALRSFKIQKKICEALAQDEELALNVDVILK